MKTYTFYWLTGDVNELKGNTPEEALTLGGFSAGALPALDFWEEGKNDEKYVYNKEQHTWIPIIHA